MVLRLLTAGLIVSAACAAPGWATFGYTASLKGPDNNPQVLSISTTSNVQFTPGSGDTLECDGGGTVLHLLQGNGFSGSNDPDPFNTTYTVSVTLTDYTSTASPLTFTGAITGSFSNRRSSIVNTFTGPTTKSVTLNGVTYTVTMLSFVPPGPPVTAEKADILAFVTCAPTGTALSSVTLAPTAGKTGRFVNGTVTLNGPAPRGGAIVNLTSSVPAALTVPATLTIPEGATSATFIAAANGASTGLQVTAAWNGTTLSQPSSVTAALCADIDGNGTINMLDAIHLMRGFAGLEPLPNC